MNTWDPLGQTPWKRTTGDPLNGTFNGEQDIYAQITLLMDPNAEFTQQEGNQTANTLVLPAPSEKIGTVVKTPDVQIPNLLPDGYL